MTSEQLARQLMTPDDYRMLRSIAEYGHGMMVTPCDSDPWKLEYYGVVHRYLESWILSDLGRKLLRSAR